MGGISTYHRPKMKARILAGDMPGWLQRHCRKNYIIQYILSFPPWVDKQVLLEIECHARQLSSLHGIPFEVDHYIPINHPLVCGLTVPNNLQILSQVKNGSKGNAWSNEEVEQLSLFESTPEQYELRL